MARDYDNVIIFGAGASADAGIPMMDSFVNKMWEYAIRGKVNENTIPTVDRDLLTEANKIRIGLEQYNSRALFDNSNIEDILSLLSFEALADANRDKYELMVKAISRTIELSCELKFQTEPLKRPYGGSEYHGFWHCLLQTEIKNALPALITFNYDLVFERSLFEHFHFLEETSGKRLTKSASIQYNHGIYDFTIRGERCHYDYSAHPQQPDFRIGERGQFNWVVEGDITIPYLKLHGSLNWDERLHKRQKIENGNRLLPTTFPTQAVECPLILPPVFNKTNSVKIESVWETALQILRKAKNIIIVGYSLPKTDIYMQYFLKSAIGPNSDLQKIIIFDPTLFKNNSKATEMEQRYKECFAPQFINRLIFQPPLPSYRTSYTTITQAYEWPGKFRHFVEILRTNPKELFFYP